MPLVREWMEMQIVIRTEASQSHKDTCLLSLGEFRMKEERKKVNGDYRHVEEGEKG
jgi:hypothetical protein